MKYSDSVSHCIEVLCQKGCREVWCIIDALDRGEPLPETQHLNSVEVAQVRNELKAIMAVYEGKCIPG